MTISQRTKTLGNGEERPGTPEVVSAAKGTFPGDINLQWDAVDGARSYVLQILEENGKNWKQIDIVTEPYYMLSGLKSGSRISFRIAAVFSTGQGKWSKEFSRDVS